MTSMFNIVAIGLSESSGRSAGAVDESGSSRAPAKSSNAVGIVAVKENTITMKAPAKFSNAGGIVPEKEDTMKAETLRTLKTIVSHSSYKANEVMNYFSVCSLKVKL